MVMSDICAHKNISCVNPYEIIRKYLCADCGAVMMCDCDEAFGRRFLPHQLKEGCELRSKRRLPVTLGFQPEVCSECRGLPVQPYPKAEIYGHTSKIKRYYWREIIFAEMKLKAEWDEQNKDSEDDIRRDAYDLIEKNVLDSIKFQHETSPKYSFCEPSQADVIRNYNVDVVEVRAHYVDNPKKGLVIQHGDGAISPESFVINKMQSEGWSVLNLESVPLHCLFGVMMWLVVQDPADPLCKVSGFGNRNASDTGAFSEMIWTLLPEDFGSDGYAERRKYEIDEHFKLFGKTRDDLLWVFDYWRCYSSNFRQYLWAHNDRDVEKARDIISIVNHENIVKILRYLVEGYWKRYLGWPDLLAHRGDDFVFVEVKSSSDKLSLNQKNWIIDNSNILKLPFKIVKVLKF